MSERFEGIDRYRQRLEALEAGARAGEMDALQLLQAARTELERLAREQDQSLTETMETGLLSSITDGLAAIDRNWRIVYINSWVAEILGYSAAQLLDQNVWEMFPRFLGQEVEQVFRRVMDGGAPALFDSVASSGRWYSVRVYPSRTGITIFVMDTSTIKRADLQRDASIERLGLLVEFTAGILACKTDHEALELAARASLTLTGARSAVAYYQVTGYQEIQACAGETREAFSRGLAGFQESGVYQHLLEPGANLRLNRQQLQEDPGWLRGVEDRLPLDHLLGASLADASGRATGLLLVTGKESGEFTTEEAYLLTQVASQLSLALQHLRSITLAQDNAAELDAIFVSTSDALIVYNRQGEVVRANPAARRLFGGSYPSMNPDQFDSGAFHLFQPDGRPLNARELPFHAQILRGQPVGWSNFRCQFPDGRQVELNVSGNPLLDSSGQLSGAVTVWHDITDLEQSRRQAEQEANRAGLLAEELNSVFAAMTDAVMVFNQQGEPVRLNPAAREWYDFEVTHSPLEETLNHIRLRKLDGRSFSVEELPSRRALRGEIVVSEPAIQVRPDGSDQVILSSAAPVFDSSGKITGSVVVWHHLTEPERIDLHYRRQREILERIIEQAPVGIALLDGPEHRLSLANKEIHALARDKGQILGRTVAEIWPELSNQLMPVLDNIYNAGEPYQVDHMPLREPWGAESQTSYFSFRCTPLKGHAGEVDAILVLVQETTGEVRSRMDLEHERALLKAVIESAPVAIVIVDANAQVLASNPSADQIYQRPVPYGEDYASHAALQICYPDGTPCEARDLPLTRSALERETCKDVELAIRWPDGQLRRLVVNTAPITNAAGDAIGAVGIFDDVTDFLRATSHDHFQAELGQALLGLTQAEDIFALVITRLREHLGIDRVMLNEIDQTSGQIKVHEDHREGLPPLPDPFNFGMYPQRLLADFRQGRAFWSGDILADERMTEVNEAMAQYGFRALVLHPRRVNDHSLLSMNASHAAPRDWNEDELALIGSVTDLAWLALERSRLLRDVRLSEQRYRRLFESNVIGVTYSYLDGNVIEANDAFLSIVGFTRHDLEQGRIDWRALTPAEYLALDSQAVAESMERGYCTPFEKEYLRKDGGRVPVMIGFSPLDVTATQFVCFVLDMSEQKRYRDALRESQKRLEMALRGSPVVMYAQDTQLRYTWSFNRHPVFAPEDLVGHTDADFMDGEDAALLSAMKRQVMKSRKGQRKDVTLRINGEVVIQDLTIEPQINEQGEVIGVVCLVVDVTERYRLEGEMRNKAAQVELQHTILQHREQERLKIARDLHDGLLQELVGISLGLSDIPRHTDSEMRLSRLQQLRASLDRQIHDLRAFCTDLRPPALAPFGVERALGSYLETYRERNPELSVHADLMQDGQTLNEVVRLTVFRICQELLNNAARHAQAGQVWVSFAVSPERVILEVRDDGRGFIPPDRWIYLAREGHFGLIGIHERVDALNGRMILESAPGQGTRVNVSLPLINNPAIEGKIEL